MYYILLCMYNVYIYIYIIYDGLSPERVLWRKFPFEKENLLYDAKSEHYNVITNLKAAMAKRYICNACDTLYDLTQASVEARTINGRKVASYYNNCKNFLKH